MSTLRRTTEGNESGLVDCDFFSFWSLVKTEPCVKNTESIGLVKDERRSGKSGVTPSSVVKIEQKYSLNKAAFSTGSVIEVWSAG